jgi:hypothetical protein
MAGYPYTVASSSSVTGVPNLDRQGQEGNPMIAVDPYNSELIYVVYGQDTSGSSSGDPGIFLQVSGDGGMTWTAAIQVNDNLANDTSRYFPWIAANPADGSMNIGWYDRRDDSANNDLTAYFGARVTDGGTANLTVSMNFRISDVNYLSSMPGSTCGSPIYGDYNMVAAGPNFMYAAWASPASPNYITPASTDVDVFFSAIVSGSIPQISPSGLLEYGDVCVGSSDTRELNICNTGKADLVVNSVTSSNSQFTVAPVTFPLVISPDFCFPVLVDFTPTTTAEETADVTIVSNDPLNPTIVLVATGSGVTPDINLAIADSGDFGAVCKDDHADLDLTLFNQGKCDLTISALDLLPDSDSFALPANLQLPLILSPDAAFALPLRYAPEECFFGKKQRTLRITSDDPDEMTVNVGLKGKSPCPEIIIDPGSLSELHTFPTTVVDTTGTLGCFSERTAVLRNVGTCPATISSITAAAADFTVTAPTQLPILLPSGEETLSVTVRFTPQSDANPLAPSEVTGLLTVDSDDPSGPDLADLCGESSAQSGVRILVTEVNTGTPIPLAEVGSLTISSQGVTPRTNLRFTDHPVSMGAVCGNPVVWHVDQETLQAAGTTGNNPQGSYTAKAKEGSEQITKTFGLGQCELREFQLQLGGGGVCLLRPKGDSCTNAGECCSGKCKGPEGGKTCK